MKTLGWALALMLLVGCTTDTTGAAPDGGLADDAAGEAADSADGGGVTADTGGEALDVADSGGEALDVADTGGEALDVADTGGEALDVADSDGEALDVADTGGEALDVADSGGEAPDAGDVWDTLPPDAGGDVGADAVTPPDTGAPDATGDDAASPDGDTGAEPDCVVDSDCPLSASPCQIAACDEGVCALAPAANGTACDDGDACTLLDTCQAGACAGDSTVTCEAADPCHVAGTCDPATGTCSSPPAANGTACDDGSPCTLLDTCQSGVCAGGSTVTCEAADPCHVPGTCDPATGACSSPPAPSGTACDDGDACTLLDTCQAGACAGDSTVTCEAADPCHVAGTCDPATGACSSPPAPNGTACDDGSPCTVGDLCTAGACGGAPLDCDDGVACTADACSVEAGGCTVDITPCGCATDADCLDTDACNGVETCDPTTLTCKAGAAVSCASLDDACNVGVCAPQNGSCGTKPRPNATPCDDGSACTQVDSCQAGVCVGGAKIPCPAVDACHLAGACDPATGACSSPSAPDGAACDDGDACTQVDSCQTGVCTGTSPVICSAIDGCHVPGTCAPATGVCSNPAAPDGVACDDGAVCTVDDACLGGLCTGVPMACSDGIGCTEDMCSQEAGGCWFDASQCACTVSADCDDGNPCNGAETCIQNACKKGKAVSCSGLDDACNVGTCTPATGACAKSPRPDGTTCDDGNQCTTTDTCLSGACTGAGQVACPPLDACHLAGACDPATGACSSPLAPAGSPCDDGDACTLTDTCSAGACVSGSPAVCVASDVCHAPGTCAPATGECSNPPATNGKVCDDGNLCTSGDTCQEGACVPGQAITCPSQGQCYQPGTCSPATGQCSTAPKADGTACADGDPCTLGDICQAGVCAGTPKSCPQADQCHLAGDCNQTTGVCSNDPRPNGTPCNDANACTLGDTCQGGTCAPGAPKVCTAIGQCYAAGTCNPSNGACSTPYSPSGAPCDDGDLCTSASTCSFGQCVGGGAVVCQQPPASSCLVGVCAPATGVCGDEPLHPGTPCNDDDPCTLADACDGVGCTGTPRDNAPADWATALGLPGGTASVSLVPVTGGVAAVGSYTGDADFGKVTLSSGAGLEAIYLARFAESGAPQGAKNLGTTDGGFAVGDAAADADGRLTVVGAFSGSAVFGSGGSAVSVAAGFIDVFIAHYDATGGLLWVNTAPGGLLATAAAVVALPDGSVVAAGTNLKDVEFPTKPGFAPVTVPGGGTWLVRYSSGGVLAWGKRIADTVLDDIALAPNAELVDRVGMTGTYSGTVTIGVGATAFTQAAAGSTDAAIVNLSTADASVVWHKNIGGSGADRAAGIAPLRQGYLAFVDMQGAGGYGTGFLHSTAAAHDLHLVLYNASGGLNATALVGGLSGADNQGLAIARSQGDLVTIAGLRTGVTQLWGNAGTGSGLPITPPTGTLKNSPDERLFVARFVYTSFGSDLSLGWAADAGGASAGIAAYAGWGVDLVEHPSLAMTLAGMFNVSADFGHDAPQTLSAPAGGASFLAHINSAAALDYCE